AARSIVERLARSDDVVGTAAGILKQTSPDEALSLAAAVAEAPEYFTPPLPVPLRALVLSIHCSVFRGEDSVPAAPPQDIVLQHDDSSRWQTASEILRLAFSICQTAFAQDHSRLAACLAGLAAAGRGLGNYDAAEELLQCSLAAYRAAHDVPLEAIE